MVENESKNKDLIEPTPKTKCLVALNQLDRVMANIGIFTF